MKIITVHKTHSIMEVEFFRKKIYLNKIYVINYNLIKEPVNNILLLIFLLSIKNRSFRKYTMDLEYEFRFNVQ